MGDILTIFRVWSSRITEQILYPEGLQDQIFTFKCKHSETLHILPVKIIELNSNMITREHLLHW